MRFNCGHLCSVANEGSHPSQDIQASQAAVTQEAEPITAQRRQELEHYLKLKRYRTAFFFFVWAMLAEVVHSHFYMSVRCISLCQPRGFHCIFLCLFLSNGWLQDRSGQWVKDENVEFDSDEEEPPSLAPLPTSHRED